MTGLRMHNAKLVVKSSIEELCVEKRKIGNSWYWIVVKDTTDQKYDLIGNHLARGVKGKEISTRT